jgi:ABC-2 type transport system ATP-binding protein
VDETVARMLEQTALADRADDQVGTLSGGNRQRLNVALGLLGDPRLLLLDEPSTALDPRQRDRLWEFVTALSAAGTTVIFTTHNVQEAERHATQLVVLADGERLFDGSPSELRTVAEGADFESAFVAFLAAKGH